MSGRYNSINHSHLEDDDDDADMSIVDDLESNGSHGHHIFTPRGSTRGSRTGSLLSNPRTNLGMKPVQHTPSSSSLQFKAPQIHEKCPTCDGKGKIRKDTAKEGKSSELIALIPYSDKRLKPRHTRMKIAAAVFFTFAIALIIGVIVFPRPVTVDVVKGHAFNLNISCKPPPLSNRVGVLNMTILWEFSVRNKNLFPVSFKPVHIHLLTLYNSSISNATVDFKTMPKGTTTFQMNISATFTRDAQHIYGTACSKTTKPPYNQFPVNFVLASTTKILTFNEDVSNVHFPMVHCPVPSSPIGPSNHSTTTTTTPFSTTTTLPKPITTSHSHTPLQEYDMDIIDKDAYIYDYSDFAPLPCA